MNRIDQAIQVCAEALARGLQNGALTPKDIAESVKEYEMSPKEHTRTVNEVKMAIEEGDCTREDGEAILKRLGDSAEFYNSQPPEVKLVLNNLHTLPRV
jgi:hypothetical protein